MWYDTIILEGHVASTLKMKAAWPSKTLISLKYLEHEALKWGDLWHIYKNKSCTCY